jgi:integrase
MATITERKGKRGVRYWATIRRLALTGKASISQGFDSHEEAQTWVDSIEKGLREDIRAGRSATYRTVADAIAAYRADPEIEPKLTDNDKRLLNWWSEVLGDERLSLDPKESLNAGQVKAARRMLQAMPKRRGRGHGHELLAPSSVNRYVSRFASCMKWALSEGWISVSPCQQLRLSERGRAITEREAMLTPKQIAALLKAAREDIEAQIHPFIMLALATGARREDLQKLTWANVDLEKNEAFFAETKNHESYTVALSFGGDVLSELKRQRDEQDVVSLDGSDLVFTAPKRGGRFDPRPAWDRVRAKAGLGPTDEKLGYRFHNLRHVHGSLVSGETGSNEAVRMSLRQKTPDMAARYSHSLGRKQRNEIANAVTAGAVKLGIVKRPRRRAPAPQGSSRPNA